MILIQSILSRLKSRITGANVMNNLPPDCPFKGTILMISFDIDLIGLINHRKKLYKAHNNFLFSFEIKQQ